MKAADHHLRWIGQAVVQSRKLTRPEPICPVRVFQFTTQARLIVGESGECEETILEETRQTGTVLQVLDRLSLSVQYPLDAFNKFIATGQEELEKFEMCLKWHLALAWTHCFCLPHDECTRGRR
jgi:hypothetical protein